MPGFRRVARRRYVIIVVQEHLKEPCELFTRPLVHRSAVTIIFQAGKKTFEKFLLKVTGTIWPIR